MGRLSKGEEYCDQAAKISSRHHFFVSAIACAQNSYAAEKMKLGLSIPMLSTPFFRVLVDATKQTKQVGSDVVRTVNANYDASQRRSSKVSAGLRLTGRASEEQKSIELLDPRRLSQSSHHRRTFCFRPQAALLERASLCSLR